MKNFCSVNILSQCIEYLINFQNIYTFAYQKFYPYALFEQVFSCEFCEISENTFFHRKPRMAASEYKS